jgi:tetratricopeptide (TPR) repeat protein
MCLNSIGGMILFALILLPSFPESSPLGQSLLQQGDELYAQRSDPAKALEALAKYQAALAGGEDAYEASWKMAMVEYRIADRTSDEAEKKKILDSAIAHGKRAVQLAPEKPEGHYWLGVNYGIYAVASGARKRLSLVKPIKEEMKKVLALDPSYADGGADRVLGRVFYELPKNAGGNNQRSLKHLLQSKAYGPRVALTGIYLADTYLALNEIEKAREELAFVMALEPDPLLIPETMEAKELARKKLEQLVLKKSG